MMKKMMINAAKILLNHEETVRQVGILLVCLNLAYKWTRGSLGVLSLIVFGLVLNLIYPFIELAVSILVSVLLAAARAFLKECGESAEYSNTEEETNDWYEQTDKESEDYSSWEKKYQYEDYSEHKEERKNDRTEDKREKTNNYTNKKTKV